MEELMKYIFKSIGETQDSVLVLTKGINKKFRAQVRSNKILSLAVICIAVQGIMLNKDLQVHERKIEDLEHKIDSIRIEKMQRDLRTAKGE